MHALDLTRYTINDLEAGSSFLRFLEATWRELHPDQPAAVGLFASFAAALEVEQGARVAGHAPVPRLVRADLAELDDQALDELAVRLDRSCDLLERKGDTFLTRLVASVGRLVCAEWRRRQEALEVCIPEGAARH